jgi:hypothetical protein
MMNMTPLIVAIDWDKEGVLSVDSWLTLFFVIAGMGVDDNNAGARGGLTKSKYVPPMMREKVLSESQKPNANPTGRWSDEPTPGEQRSSLAGPQVTRNGSAGAPR